MAYQRVIHRLKKGVEVEDYHSNRYGAPGEERQKKKKATPEQMARQNQYQKEKKARHKLMEHFEENDYFSLLTYRREARPPDMKTAKKQFSEFMKVVRREYRKRGVEVKWLRNIEVGTKNGWHVHLIINRIPDTDIILKMAWEYGKTVNQLLYEWGGFVKLAAYITKTPQTDSRLKETSYSASRNLPVPPPEKYTYLRWKTWNKEHLRIPKGHYLDKESFHEGRNRVTGHPYRRYIALKIPDKDSRKQRRDTPGGE